MRNARRTQAAAVFTALALAAGGVLAQAAGGAGSAGGSTSGAGMGTGTGGASGSAQESRGTSASLAAADRNFLVRAAGSGLAELEAARMAADKAKDEAVKRYASKLVDEHTAANQELMGLAQGKGVTLPTSMPSGKRRDINRLNRASGEDFDATFVQMIGVREHRQDLRLFREASRNAKDPEVKAWAAKMLPTLEQHMKEAQALPAAKVPMDNASQTYGKGF